MVCAALFHRHGAIRPGTSRGVNNVNKILLLHEPELGANQLDATILSKSGQGWAFHQGLWLNRSRTRWFCFLDRSLP